MSLILWRCFPWDPDAAAGKPHSASYLAPGQRSGRFDLQDDPPVLYLGDNPAHVVSESLQGYRNTEYRPAMLKKLGHRLALVEVQLGDPAIESLADLCDPALLTKQGIRPDATAHHDRTITQAIARGLLERGFGGLRWWSVTTGAWHTYALFAPRIPAPQIKFGPPQALTTRDDAVLEARRMLGIR